MMQEEGVSQGPAKREDRWLVWPTIVLFAVAFSIVLLCGIPGTISFVLIPLMALGWPLVAVALLMLASLFAARRRHRKAISICVAVFLIVVFWKPISWLADCAHIVLTVGIGSVLTSPSDRFAAYDWSVGFAGGANTFLIYDDTDEIELPPSQHKNPISAENGFGEDCAGRVDHLIGHYYRCVF